MIKETIITFETAQLAKKVHADLNSIEFYTHRGDLCYAHKDENQNQYTGSYGAFTQSLLQKWFREKFNIHIVVVPEKFDSSNTCIYKYIIFNRSNVSIKLDSSGIVGNYEEALEIGLREAFKYNDDECKGIDMSANEVRERDDDPYKDVEETLEAIIADCSRLTAGNVSHNAASMRGAAQIQLDFIREHKKETEG